MLPFFLFPSTNLFTSTDKSIHHLPISLNGTLLVDSTNNSDDESVISSPKVYVINPVVAPNITSYAQQIVPTPHLSVTQTISTVSSFKLEITHLNPPVISPEQVILQDFS